MAPQKKTLQKKPNTLFIFPLVGTFLSGAITTLAYAPYHFWGIIFASLIVPVMLCQQRTLKQCAALWFSYGMGKFCFGISWVHISIDTYGGMPFFVSLLLMFALCAYLSLYPMLAGIIAYHLKVWRNPSRLCLFFPAIWLLTEVARGYVFTGFPWLWEGYALTDSVLKPLGSVIGAVGLTYFIVLFNCSLVAIITKRDWRALLISSAACAALFVIAAYYQVVPSSEKIDVSLVQGNIAQSIKWQPEALQPTLDKYKTLSQGAKQAQLVIWPEAAVPAPISMTGQFLATTHATLLSNNQALITGIIHLENKNDFYNSIMVFGNVEGDNTTAAPVRFERDVFGFWHALNHEQIYNKHHLLPVGEFVPFGDLLRPLAPFFNLPMSSFMRGGYVQPNLIANGYHILPALCYEIAFSEQVRANLTEQTDILLTLSNDAWFGDSIGPWQHLQMAKMRSIELGKSLVRGTNNGVTAAIDGFGNIIQAAPQFQEHRLDVSVPTYEGETLFSKLGHWPSVLLSLIMVAAGLVTARKR